ncbi:MAG: 3-methyl-2-oxobutanoate hydroxymethyltransferase [Syntrophomonadaceae bacterium]|nr:3-methyl-2-oxobutanoate hydroxymethyltransferase [Syntrophomonadaceae bacterium]
MARATVLSLKEKKRNGQKISMLTAYDFPTARMMDEVGIDMILVGDSLGNVVLGYETTLFVTMDDMVHHTKAVTRAAKNTMVVADMPFLSFHISVEESLRNAGRLMQEAGAHAVKIEGGRERVAVVRALTESGIPVMGHIGLTPQTVHQLGGFRVQGKDVESARRLIDDAKALEEAGAFAVVLECVPAPLAKKVTQEVGIPTIGIGAGPDCDGQVLVNHDMIGLFGGHVAKFVRQYAQVGEIMKEAFKAYKEDVEKGTFPAEEHCYTIKEDVLDKLY